MCSCEWRDSRRLEKHVGPLEQELQAVVCRLTWVLRIMLGSYAAALLSLTIETSLQSLFPLLTTLYTMEIQVVEGLV